MGAVKKIKNESIAKETDTSVRLQDYFVSKNKDRFTMIQSFHSKKSINIKVNKRNRFELSLGYGHQDDADLLFLDFYYEVKDEGYPNIGDIEVYLILDNSERIVLKDVIFNERAFKDISIDSPSLSYTGQVPNLVTDWINDYQEQLSYQNGRTLYMESTRLKLSLTDFMKIVNSNVIEYSFRYNGNVNEGSFEDHELVFFKGFYNNVFDQDFEVSFLKDSIKKELLKKKKLKDLDNAKKVKQAKLNKKIDQQIKLAILLYGVLNVMGFQLFQYMFGWYWLGAAIVSFIICSFLFIPILFILFIMKN